jgi:uncharacterized protein (DUF2141 family)
MRIFYFRLLLVFVSCFIGGCANITAPTGGKKDTTPPRLVSIIPGDSLLDTRTTEITLRFDEYVTLSDVSKELTISPTLSIPPVATSLYKRVTVKIPDSLLEDKTTYRLSFGSAIRDLHEGNPFKDYTYTFSTTYYFDSLELKGNVINAGTGLADVPDVVIGLYNASETDSAVVRHKPKYVIKADASGNFSFKGLPKRVFKIYAIKDVNGNFTYDGPAGGEMIGFIDSTVVPGDSSTAFIKMRIFTETDTASKGKDDGSDKRRMAAEPAKSSGNLSYVVNIDTGNVTKRTFDITKPITITFNNGVVLNNEKIALSYDQNGAPVIADITISEDSVLKHTYHINTQWAENKVYTLKLAKGFAKDSAGSDLMPARYSFRTNEDIDYGKVKINLPSRFTGKRGYYLLRAIVDNDTVYQKPVTDSAITLSRLKQGKYTFAIIKDDNRDGKWTTGDLFAKQQPEIVLPFPSVLTLKAGWENVVDFEPKKDEKRTRAETGPKR